jgi:hypothetical protein
MTLQSILPNLSEPVRVELEKWFTLSVLPNDPTPGEVFEAANKAVYKTKTELPTTVGELQLLGEVPAAIVADLFPDLIRGVDW